MIVQDRLPWGRRVRYSVIDWGRLVSRQSVGRGKGIWEERGGWLAARRSAGGCIEGACGRGAEPEMALVSCQLWKAHIGFAFRFTVVAPAIATDHRGTGVPLIGRARRSVSLHNWDNVPFVISSLMQLGLDRWRLGDESCRCNGGRLRRRGTWKEVGFTWDRSWSKEGGEG